MRLAIGGNDMSVTYGFFNSINHDRKYDAKQMSSLFDGIIRDGIFMNVGNAMRVKSNPGEEDLKNMMVYVETGRCWFNSTWTLNDSILPIEIESSELVLDRIDTIVIEVNSTDSVRANSIKVLKGEPSTNPVGIKMEDNEYVHQYPLARILVKAEASEITQADITNCIGTGECPYITGILETVNADGLLAQWQDEFERWILKTMGSINTWVDEVRDASGTAIDVVKSALWTEVTGTLPAGSRSITFTNMFFGDDAKLDYYTDQMGYMPTSDSLNGSDYTLYFDSDTKDHKITIRIYL